MKSNRSIIKKKANIALSASAVLLAFAAAANAQVLQTYFNFANYGTVAGGGTVVDQTGNTTATLNNDPNTFLTGSGLAITAGPGGNSINTGLTFASGSLSSFTGSFTIQDWVTPASGGGAVLFGGSSGAPNTYIGDGYTGVSTLIGFNWGSLVGGGGTGNPLGQPYNRYGNTISGYALTPGTLYDLVLAYDASTYTFHQYINGTLVGSLQEAFSSTSLAGVQTFAIGGAVNEPWAPWGDSSAAQTTSAFLLYNELLTSSQVSALDTAGAGASLGTINGIVAAPEPCTLALAAFGGAFLLVLRRRQAI
jgi:hypothetical protein